MLWETNNFYIIETLNIIIFKKYKGKQLYEFVLRPINIYKKYLRFCFHAVCNLISKIYLSFFLKLLLLDFFFCSFHELEIKHGLSYKALLSSLLFCYLNIFRLTFICNIFLDKVILSVFIIVDFYFH